MARIAHAGAARARGHAHRARTSTSKCIATITCSVKYECKILIRNQLVLKLHWILSSDSVFHRTVNSPIEDRESRVLISDPRSWILDQV